MSAWETVIGLEVHAQLSTRTKIFCDCPVRFGSKPNANTCPVCLGRPGAMPALNREAVDLAVRASVAFGCRIAPVSVFERKHYFYPDLPKGYQISQYARPLAEGGGVPLENDAGEPYAVPLLRIHMEEDAGKSIHDGFPDSDRHAYVDLNRAGTPLIEIVSEPAVRSPGEAHRYLERLRSTLRWLAVCDGDMERGSFRCDANVSIRPAGASELGTRTEIKNLNSFRFVQKALAYEVERQRAEREAGRPIVQETRLWDPGAGETRPMRGKEEAEDYRYFPEPDLRPLAVPAERSRAVAEALPELPWARKARWKEQFGLGPAEAHQLTLEREIADFYEAVAEESGDPKAAANWTIHDLARERNKDPGRGREIRLAPARLAELIGLVADGTISSTVAKELFEEVYARGASARELVESRGLAQIDDVDSLAAIVDDVIAANPDQVAAYRGGKAGLLGYLVGQAMKASGGRANPQRVRERLVETLGPAGGDDA